MPEYIPTTEEIRAARVEASSADALRAEADRIAGGGNPDDIEAEPETYSVYGGQGLMRIAAGLSRADAERVSRKFEIDCMNAGLINPPGRIVKDK